MQRRFAVPATQRRAIVVLMRDAIGGRACAMSSSSVLGKLRFAMIDALSSGLQEREKAGGRFFFCSHEIDGAKQYVCRLRLQRLGCPSMKRRGGRLSSCERSLDGSSASLSSRQRGCKVNLRRSKSRMARWSSSSEASATNGMPNAGSSWRRSTASACASGWQRSWCAKRILRRRALSMSRSRSARSDRCMLHGSPSSIGRRMRLHRHARRGVQLDAQLTKLEAQLHAKIAEAAEAPQARIIPGSSRQILLRALEQMWAGPGANCAPANAPMCSSPYQQRCWRVHRGGPGAPVPMWLWARRSQRVVASCLTRSPAGLYDYSSSTPGHRAVTATRANRAVRCRRVHRRCRFTRCSANASRRLEVLGAPGYSGCSIGPVGTD